MYKPASDNLVVEGELLYSLTLEPLIGLNVVVTVKDLKEITVATTDIEGKFRLSFKYNPDYSIKFSYIGYKKQTYGLKHFFAGIF